MLLLLRLDLRGVLGCRPRDDKEEGEVAVGTVGGCCCGGGGLEVGPLVVAWGS
jgi:hypothetical protein